MDQLIEYRRLVRILCTLTPQGNSHYYTFEVKLEQVKPHSIFKYDVVKHAQEVIQLYAQLETDIFDLNNPFSLSFLQGLTRPDQPNLQLINQSLTSLTQRIDVLTHPRFVAFFSLQLHYADFVDSLREENAREEFKRELGNETEELKKTEEKRGKEQDKLYCTDRPWMKPKQPKQEFTKEKSSFKQTSKPLKSDKTQTAFEKMTKLCRQQESWQLQTEQSSVIDFAYLAHQSGDLIFLLEQRKPTAKITNFLKTFFNQQQTCGYLSIHKQRKGKYSRTMVTELQAQPLSLKLERRASMLMVLTGVGVYIYLAQMEKNYEQAELFGYVQLPGVCDFTVNPALGQLYLLRSVPAELHAHSINKEKTMKTQFKFNRPSAICFEEHHSRLYVVEEAALNIYSVKESLEIKRLHVVPIEGVFDRLIESHSYIYAISSKGLMAIVELKPPQKEKLISVLTTIELPAQTTNLTTSPSNRRLLITNYGNCVVLIDSMEGPLQSLRLGEGSGLVKVGIDGEGRMIGVSGQGWVSLVRLNQRISS